MSEDDGDSDSFKMFEKFWLRLVWFVQWWVPWSLVIEESIPQVGNTFLTIFFHSAEDIDPETEGFIPSNKNEVFFRDPGKAKWPSWDFP